MKNSKLLNFELKSGLRLVRTVVFCPNKRCSKYFLYTAFFHLVYASESQKECFRSTFYRTVSLEKHNMLRASLKHALVKVCFQSKL